MNGRTATTLGRTTRRAPRLPRLSNPASGPESGRSAGRPGPGTCGAPNTCALPRLAALTSLTVALLAGCGAAGSDPTADPASSSGASGGTVRTAVTVFAASSLKEAFTDIAADHPELELKVTYDGSNGLVDQLIGGARADVFASADTASMARAQAQGLLAGDPVTFATNVLVLVVPAGNPGRVTGLDASLTGKKLVVCAPEVPCGRATATLTSQLGVTLRPVSEETKVTDVRGKVESGEADVGLVYATDAKAAGERVHAIPIPGADKVVNRYPVALMHGAPQPGAGQSFIDAVRSERGRQVLARHGFGTP